MFGHRKICDRVNPDEVVSYGAAVQASILSGASDKLLVDVTNFSLGTNTKGDIMVRAIHFQLTTALEAIFECFTNSIAAATHLVDILHKISITMQTKSELFGE